MSLETHTDFNYSENGTTGTATKNTTTNIDFKVTYAKGYINGGIIHYQNAFWGDYIEAQVIDIDNVLGGGVNTVLKHYIKKRYLHPNENNSLINLPYAGLIPEDVYLRVIYHSVGTSTDINLAINYFLHELP